MCINVSIFKSTGKNLFSKKGFPEIDNHAENNFYHVLSEGLITLLKSERKVVTTNKNELSG